MKIHLTMTNFKKQNLNYRRITTEATKSALTISAVENQSTKQVSSCLGPEYVCAIFHSNVIKWNNYNNVSCLCAGQLQKMLKATLRNQELLLKAFADSEKRQKKLMELTVTGFQQVQVCTFWNNFIFE